MSSSTYRVVVEAEGAEARPDWTELVKRNPGVALSKTPDWVDCICACDPFVDASLLFRDSDGRRILFPRVRARYLPGVYASPPNHWNLGADANGFLAEDGSLEPEQLRELVWQVHRRSGVRTRIVVGRDDARAWRPVVPVARTHAEFRTSHVLDLGGGFDTVWSGRFTSKVRSNSRKAERRGVTVESDTTGRLVPEFYRLFRTSVDRWARDRGYPVPLMQSMYQRHHPESKFATVARLLGEACTIWIARRAGEAIAGIIVLSRGDRATYWRGAMDKDRSRGTGANELLHRHAIERACADGRLSYDFGLSGSDDLRRFKATFGTVEEPVTTYTFEPLIATTAAQARCREVAKRSLIGAVRLARRGR